MGKDTSVRLRAEENVLNSAFPPSAIRVCTPLRDHLLRVGCSGHPVTVPLFSHLEGSRSPPRLLPPENACLGHHHQGPPAGNIISATSVPGSARNEFDLHDRS
jgi:hypothetical protein